MRTLKNFSGEYPSALKGAPYLKGKCRQQVPEILEGAKGARVFSTIQHHPGIGRAVPSMRDTGQRRKKQRWDQGLSANDRMENLENTRDNAQIKWSEDHGRVAGYKIHTEKGGVFTYTNNQAEGRVVMKTPFTTATERILYLGISLTWNGENLWEETWKHPGRQR